MTLTSLACVDSGDRAPDLISVFIALLSGSSLYQFVQFEEGETEPWRSNALCLGLGGVQEESLEKAAGLSGVQSEMGISLGFQVTLFLGSQFQPLVSNKESLIYLVNTHTHFVNTCLLRWIWTCWENEGTDPWPLQTPPYTHRLPGILFGALSLAMDKPIVHSDFWPSIHSVHS